jgi:CBS domain-containing protein
MKAKDIMTPTPHCCSPNDTVQQVARAMRDNDCGAIPVVKAGKVIGIVTDRDLAVRVLAEGKGSDARVEDFITPNPACSGADDDVRDVEKLMTDNQVRRVPIVTADGSCIGIVAQADLALAAMNGDRISENEVAVVVERVSEPRRRSFDKGLTDGVELRL